MPSAVQLQIKSVNVETLLDDINRLRDRRAKEQEKIGNTPNFKHKWRVPYINPQAKISIDRRAQVKRSRIQNNGRSHK